MAKDTRTGGREATTAIIPGAFGLSVGDPGTPPPAGFAWRALSDLARLESGHTPSRGKPEYWDGDIPWIGIRDASGNHGKVLRDTEQHVTQLGLDNSSARLLPVGTVCLSRTASVGFVVTMGRPMATSQDFVNWVCGPELDHRYLHYLLMAEQDTIRRIAYGSVHPTMYYPDAKALHVCIPSLCDQQAVATMLGALDDKIAANTKAVDRLLALADAHFALSVKSASFGQLAFGDLADVGGGGTPRTKIDDYWGGDIHWATPTDVTALAAPYLTETSRTITSEGLGACASALYPAGSIMMTSRATIGAFAIAQVPSAVNQGFIVVNAKDPANQWWLFHEMKSRVAEFLSLANGATFLELPRGRFKQLKVRVTSADVMGEFGSLVGPMHAAAAMFASESTKLASTRDELLPLLMSGKVRLKDAEKSLEEVL